METRNQTDELDEAILFAIKAERGGLPVQRVAEEVQRAYNTVLLRCMKLAANGFLHSVWYGNVRRFYAPSDEEQP